MAPNPMNRYGKRPCMTPIPSKHVQVTRVSGIDLQATEPQDGAEATKRLASAKKKCSQAQFAYEFLGFGATDGKFAYEFTGFGVLDGKFAYEFIGIGAMDGNFLYEFKGFGAMDCHVSYEFIGFGAIDGNSVLANVQCLLAHPEPCAPKKKPYRRQEFL